MKTLPCLGLVLVCLCASGARAQQAAPQTDVSALQEQIRKLESKVADYEHEKEQKAALLAITTKAAAAEYEKAKIGMSAAQRGFEQSTPAKRPDALAALKKQSEQFLPIALRAYVLLRERRREIAGQISATPGFAADYSGVLAGIELQLRTSGEDAKAILELFTALRDKMRLARALSEPRNQQAMQGLIEELKKRDYVKTGQAPIEGFAQAFELLRSLSQEAFAYTADYAAERMAVSNPETVLVRDRLAVVYVYDPAIERSYVDAFAKEFTPWMRAASPDRSTKELTFAGWSRADVVALIGRADAILSNAGSEGPAQLMPACPTTASTTGDQQAAALCPPAYAGMVVVELRARANGTPYAVASWRVREEGGDLNKGTVFPPEGFDLPVSRVESQIMLNANDFAQKVLSEGTVYKQVQELFARLKEGRGNEQPPQCPPSSPPAPPKTPDLSPSNALYSLAWAGTPWLTDHTSKGDSFGVVVGVVDAVALLGGLVAGAIALHAHNKGWKSDDAWAEASVSAFGVTAGMRLVSGIGYAFTDTRGREQPPSGSAR